MEPVGTYDGINAFEIPAPTLLAAVVFRFVSAAGMPAPFCEIFESAHGYGTVVITGGRGGGVPGE